MLLVTGTSLYDRLVEGPLPVAEVVHVAKSLLNALGAAHAAGIVHRDVKPPKVMLAATGEVLLIDFGIAVHLADTRTMNGLIIGSPGYMAPERVHGERGEAASDLFSLGATLYHAVQGDSPFHRGDPAESAAAVLHHEPPLPRAETGLAMLVMRMLEKDPACRPTITEALAVIDALPETPVEHWPPPDGDADRVRRLLGKAEGIARSVTDPTKRAAPLAHLATGLAMIDPYLQNRSPRKPGRPAARTRSRFSPARRPASPGSWRSRIRSWSRRSVCWSTHRSVDRVGDRSWT